MLTWRLLKTILILPGTVLIVIPLVLMWLAQGSDLYHSLFFAHQAFGLIAPVCAFLSLLLMVWTMRLFVTVGEGTPAPWDPPQQFVVMGPYCYMRNPMLTGVLLMLLVESIVFQSPILFLWMLAFFLLNTLYFKFSEEPALEKRFGDAYRHYKDHVHRWLPRLTPYQKITD